MNKYPLIMPLIFLIAGCAAVSGTSTSYCPSCTNSVWKSNGDAGGILLNDKMSGDPRWLQGTADAYCKERGFSSSYVDMRTRGMDYDQLFDKVSYRFSCTGSKAIVNQSQTVLDKNQKDTNNLDMDSAKKKCVDLGFKAGTEGFGKCVLKLSN